MQLTIKEAGLEELDLLMKWRMLVLKTVFKLPEDYDMTQLYEANKKYYQNTLSTGKHLAIFAYYNENIVGCGGICFYSEMPSPDNPNGKCGYLMNIFTVKEFQNQGIASRIVKYLTKRAREEEVNKIYLESTPEAFPFYQELGFTDLKDYLILGDNS